MPHIIEGGLTVGGQKFAIVVSRFNEFITSRLVAGAVDTLTRHGCAEDAITIIHVPGAFELALAAKRAAAGGAYDAVICLGCVIRGQTPHFEYVASQATRGIAEAALHADLPVTFGLITADTLEQAVDRAGTKAGNKGAEAAAGAIEMVNLMAKLPSGK
jgi:6,7-dimethyl-8-ribityllumazine synthase